MNKEFLEEEVRALGILPSFLRENFFVSKLPIFVMFAYSLIMQNYIALGYFIFALILLNLENEEYYETNQEAFSETSRGLTRPLIQKMVRRKYYHSLVYHLLIFYSGGAYVWKLIMVFFRDTISQTSNDGYDDNSGYADFEFYLSEDTNLVDLIMTFVPNIAILVMALCSILNRGYEYNIDLNKFLKSKQVFFVKYILKPVIGILLLSLPMTNISLLSLIFVTAIFASIGIWSIRSSTKDFFQPYCKVIQYLCIASLILEYLAVVPSFNRALNDQDSRWNFVFLGIGELQNAKSSLTVKSYFYYRPNRTILVLCIHVLVVPAVLFHELVLRSQEKAKAMPKYQEDSYQWWNWKVIL